MTEAERIEILERAKIFYRVRIAESHYKNTESLSLKNFNINPFTVKYLANFAFGNDSFENMAKALLYPRILGTSISTIVGNEIQFFCNEVLGGLPSTTSASTTSGIDIEFVDSIDGRRKFCQTKSGPNTINKDDVKTIKDHFIAIRNLARTNRLHNFNPITDCIVGVFYGEVGDLSAQYKNILKEYPVHVGRDFWHRLTGDENFYEALIRAFGEIAEEYDSRTLINQLIGKLANELREHYHE